MSFYKFENSKIKKMTSLLALLFVLFLSVGCAGRASSGTSASTGDVILASEAHNISDSSQTDTATTNSETGEANTDDHAEQTPVTPVTVTLQHDLDGAHAEILQGLADTFNKSNTEGVTVELIQQTEDLKWTANLETDADEAEENESTILPDLLIADIGLSNGIFDLAQPLNSFLEAYPEHFEQYRELLFDASAVTGSVRGLPFSVRADIVFYNETLLAEAGAAIPIDFATFMLAGEAVMEKRHIPLFGVCTGSISETAFLEDVLHSFGGSLIGAGSAADNIQIGFDSAEGEKAVTILLKLYRAGFIRTYDDPERMRQDFLNGSIGAYLSTSADLTYMKAERFTVTPSLLIPGDQDACAVSMKDLFLLAKDEVQQQAAFSFMAYLSSENTATLWAVGTGDLPVTMASFDFKEYRSRMETDAVSRVLAGQDTVFFFADRSEAAVSVRDELTHRLTMHANDEVTAKELIDEIKTAYEIQKGQE